MEDEANRPANPHLAPSGTYQPTAPRRARRIRECAEQNRSSAAIAKAGLRTQPADHRAEQNADHHRVRAEQYISARKTPSATRFGDGTPERRQPTETNTSTSPPSRLHAYRPVNAPSGTRSRTRRAGASTGQPGVTRRAAGHHGDTEQQRPTTSSTEGLPKAHEQPPASGVLHQVEGDANRRVSFGAWRPAARLSRRRRDRRNAPRTTAPSRTPTTTEVRPRTVHLGPKTPSAAQFGDGTPERRQCSATHRDEHLDEPTERTGPRILGTNQVEGTRSPPRTECPPYRPGADCCARGNPLVSITSTAVTVAPATGPDAVLHACRPGQRAQWTLSRTRRGRLPPGPAANAARGPPRRAERRLPPSPGRAVHRNPIARQAESRSTVSSPIFACRSRIVASCSESLDAVPPANWYGMTPCQPRCLVHHLRATGYG